jgi:hypothetical protein
MQGYHVKPADAAKKPAVPKITVSQKIHRVDPLPLPGIGIINCVSLKHLPEALS